MKALTGKPYFRKGLIYFQTDLMVLTPAIYTIEADILIQVIAVYMLLT